MFSLFFDSVLFFISTTNKTSAAALWKCSYYRGNQQRAVCVSSWVNLMICVLAVTLLDMVKMSLVVKKEKKEKREKKHSAQMLPIIWQQIIFNRCNLIIRIRNYSFLFTLEDAVAKLGCDFSDALRSRGRRRNAGRISSWLFSPPFSHQSPILLAEQLRARLRARHPACVTLRLLPLRQ